MVNATNRGMFEEVMFCWAKMLCHWWPFKPAMFPVIAMTIHPEVQRTFCLSYILLLTFAARNEVDNICCFTVSVTFQLDNRTRWRLNSFCVQYHFASLTPIYIYVYMYIHIYIYIYEWENQLQSHLTGKTCSKGINWLNNCVYKKK